MFDTAQGPIVPYDDDLRKAPSAFAPPLGTVIVGGQVLYFDGLGSTNDYALRHGSDGTVVVAERQSAGRGRHGRTWHSAAGLGLWFSVVLEEGPHDDLVFAAVLAVRDAVRPGCRLDIKWPNDLLADGRKVCGVLVERRPRRAALGIGINVHHRLTDFPESLRGTAGSLEMVTGRVWSRGEVLRAVLRQLDRQVLLLRSGRGEAIRREWIEACNLKGRQVRCGKLAGCVTDIDSLGALLLDTGHGTHRLVSGDVTVVTSP